MVLDQGDSSTDPRGYTLKLRKIVEDNSHRNYFLKSKLIIESLGAGKSARGQRGGRDDIFSNRDSWHVPIHRKPRGIIGEIHRKGIALMVQ